MNFFKIAVLSILLCSNTYAEIRKTDNLNIIKQEIFISPKDSTLVIFDIDFVLITPKDDIFILLSLPDEKKKVMQFVGDLMKDKPKHVKDSYESIILDTQEWRPVTNDTPKIFNQIKHKGYKVLGLTASGTGKYGKIQSLEKWRIQQLKGLDMEFDKAFIDATSGTLDSYIPNLMSYYTNAIHTFYPTVEDGIVFSPIIPKGEVLDAYLQYAKLKPKKIVFVDDKLKNLEAVKKYCEKENIEYVGYEYTAVMEQAKLLKPDFKKYTLQYKILDATNIWLSDAKATEILKAITN